MALVAKKPLAMKSSQKSWFGDFLGSVVQPLATIGGTALGGLVGQPALGGILGGGVGSAIKGPLSKLKKGGVAMLPMERVALVMKNRNKKGGAAKKGTTAMKKKMAKLRAMRGKK